MNNSLTKKERQHLEKIKSLPCGVCGVSGVEAHHIVQHQQYTTIPLCPQCHRGPNGIHGEKRMWKVMKLDEMAVLNETVRKLLES